MALEMSDMEHIGSSGTPYCLGELYVLLYRTKVAMNVHPGLNPITSRHNFEISYKYTYECEKCDYK